MIRYPLVLLGEGDIGLSSDPSLKANAEIVFSR
jgi:hypothetical protein